MAGSLPIEVHFSFFGRGFIWLEAYSGGDSKIFYLEFH